MFNLYRDVSWGMNAAPRSARTWVFSRRTKERTRSARLCRQWDINATQLTWTRCMCCRPSRRMRRKRWTRLLPMRAIDATSEQQGAPRHPHSCHSRWLFFISSDVMMARVLSNVGSWAALPFCERSLTVRCSPFRSLNPGLPNNPPAIPLTEDYNCATYEPPSTCLFAFSIGYMG